MELTIKEYKRDSAVRVESEGRDHTIMNLLRKTVWDVGGEAGYEKGHPYIGSSTLIVKGKSAKDARKTLEKAVKQAKDDLDNFENAFTAAL